MPPHILFDISAHGLGHIAQSAPVVDAVVALRPDVRITVRSGIPMEALRRRISSPFEHLETADDFGLSMSSSFIVDRDATRCRYRELHDRLDRTLDELAETMRLASVDLVVSNIGYLALGAATRAGIENVAFSSINWHDVVRHYCGSGDEMASILRDMARIYHGAGQFLRLEPGTAMREFDTTPVPELVVAQGRKRRAELCDRLLVDPRALIVAFSFTEAETQPPPRLEAGSPPGLVSIGPSHWATGAPWHPLTATGMDFLDLVSTSDLIIAKPGYGIVTEAATAGVPTLLVPRDDWPETGTTSQWYRRHGRFETTRVALDELTTSDLLLAHSRLIAKDAGPRPATNGAERIARAVVARLR